MHFCTCIVLTETISQCLLKHWLIVSVNTLKLKCLVLKFSFKNVSSSFKNIAFDCCIFLLTGLFYFLKNVKIWRIFIDSDIEEKRNMECSWHIFLRKVKITKIMKKCHSRLSESNVISIKEYFSKYKLICGNPNL